jgi:predicted MFS family arabinose efflux permease
MMFLNGALAARVFLSFAAGYLLSYAFRSINAVIAPSLLADLGLSNADLGLLSAAYFLSFACLQLPLGIWLDKYGPRKIEAALLLVAALGAAIFASSTSLAGLWLGRALIGIGVSACLMAPYKAFRIWYAPEQQAQLASWMLVAGSAGALLSTVPVSAALPFIGWRGVFWIMAGMVVLAATMIFIVLKRAEEAHAKSRSPTDPQPDAGNIGYGHIFRNAYFRRLALLGLVCSGSFSAMHTLWAGPWMVTVLGISRPQTAQILFAFNLCMMLSYVALSWWAPRQIFREGRPGAPATRAIAIGLLGAIIVQTAIVTLHAGWAWIFWIPFAVFITVTTVVQTSVSLSFPTALAGRANSAYNLMVFIGIFTVQWGIGVLIDTFEGFGANSSTAMRAAFAVCIALQAAALIAFLLNPAQPAHAAHAAHAQSEQI